MDNAVFKTVPDTLGLLNSNSTPDGADQFLRALFKSISLSVIICLTIFVVSSVAVQVLRTTTN